MALCGYLRPSDDVVCSNMKVIEKIDMSTPDRWKVERSTDHQCVISDTRHTYQEPTCMHRCACGKEW